ncbi:N-6 DNA methylase [Rickettsia montanensis]|uniref:N-6 DNA methylase n=1 Tax=Rickettsia montanensis TaxID=33991 RepID=UPI0003071B60|nr:N-6 DNA methylase [Rickettsia montanensis]
MHCLQNLKGGGRMALVVPEWFLFRKDTAAVRQFLLSKAKLQFVISLPQGTFLPYTGVKTSILYFTMHINRIIKKNIGFMRLRISALLKKRKIVGINDLNRRGWKIKFI